MGMDLYKSFEINPAELSSLKKGGQKEVFRGKNQKYGNFVLKIGNISSLDRIMREVEILKNISSDFYPKIYEFEINLSEKSFFIVEEYIEGETLDNFFSRFYKKELEIISLLKQLVDGLSIIWEKEIVHRDIKPTNLIMKPDGSLVIIDLGIARVLNLDSLTQTILVSGPCTPYYASPEQLNNKKDEIGIRSDFFSIGILVSELFLGFNPFGKDIQEVPNNILSNKKYDFALDNEMSLQLKNLLVNLLHHHPFQRFRNHQKIKKYLEENWK